MKFRTKVSMVPYLDRRLNDLKGPEAVRNTFATTVPGKDVLMGHPLRPALAPTAFNSGDGIHTNNHGHRLLYERVVAADLIGSAATSVREWRGGAADASRGAAGFFPELIFR